MISAWLLALITLVICSAIGVYYLNPELYTFVPEGFFSVKTDQAKCEASRSACIEVGGGNATCTAIYEDCTMKAALANPNVSKVPNAPSDPTQTSTSSSAAKAYAANYRDGSYIGDLGSGDKTLENEYAAKRAAALNGLNVESSDAYKKLLASLSGRITSGGGADKPTAAQLSLVQGDDTGYSGAAAADYKAHQEIIRPHMTPTELKAAILAKVSADRGTQAQTIQEDSILTPSVRDMIRNDVKKANKDEINDIKNEYEIQYDN